MIHDREAHSHFRQHCEPQTVGGEAHCYERQHFQLQIHSLGEERPTPFNDLPKADLSMGEVKILQMKSL